MLHAAWEADYWHKVGRMGSWSLAALHRATCIKGFRRR